jgi:Fe-S-cluster containining protein
MSMGVSTDAELPECMACGVCCFSTLPEYVRVFGADWERLDDRARAFTHFIGNRCYMRLEDGHCAALVIDPVARRFSCAIYEMRPDCCRALTRGLGACLAERHEKADRPLIAIDTLLRRPP